MFNNTLIRVSGNDGVVIYTVIAYVSQLILMTMMGINQGMQPLVSYYHGGEEHKIHKYILRIALIVAERHLWQHLSGVYSTRTR